MKRIFGKFFAVMAIAITTAASTFGQNGFAYQAVIRNAEGQLITNKQVDVKFTLLHDGGEYYVEKQSVKTNEYGNIQVVVGEGTKVDGDYANVPWNSLDIDMKVEVSVDKGAFVELGTTKVQAAPYAFYAQKAGGYTSVNSASKSGDALFAVNDANGNPVFAVFNDGIVVYVDDSETAKAKRSGFVVTGRSATKDKPANEYFSVTAEGTQIYVGGDTSKAKRSGFVVTGRSATKDGEATDYLTVGGEGTTVYVDDEDKAKRSGFVVTGRSATKEGVAADYFAATADGTTVYVDDDTSKAKRSGFVVTGRSATKEGEADNYLQVGGEGTQVYVDGADSEKAKRSGFVVTGRSATKDDEKLFAIEGGYTRVYIDDTDEEKAKRSGFVVTGRSATKDEEGPVDYFAMDGETVEIVTNEMNVTDVAEVAPVEDTTGTGEPVEEQPRKSLFSISSGNVQVATEIILAGDVEKKIEADTISLDSIDVEFPMIAKIVDRVDTVSLSAYKPFIYGDDSDSEGYAMLGIYSKGNYAKVSATDANNNTVLLIDASGNVTKKTRNATVAILMPEGDSVLYIRPLRATNQTVSFGLMKKNATEPYQYINVTAEIEAEDGIPYNVKYTANNDGGYVTTEDLPVYGEKVTFEAVANEGFMFVGWSDGSTQPVHTVTILDDFEITAEFDILQYIVTAKPNRSSYGTVEGAGNYSYGEEAFLQAIAIPGYYFSNWSGIELDEEEQTKPSIVLTVTKNLRLIANFGKLEFAPFNDEPVALPGVVEAEDFDYGKDAYYNQADGTSWNVSPDVQPYTYNIAYREYEGNYIGIDSIFAGEYALSFTDQGDWYNYTVKVDEAQSMRWALRYANYSNRNAKISVTRGKEAVIESVSTPTTQGWWTYRMISGATKDAMPVGIYKLKLNFIQSACNVDKIMFGKADDALLSIDIKPTEETTPHGWLPMGTVTGYGFYAKGTTVTVTATADKGYYFAGWSDGVASATREIKLTEDTHIDALFKEAAEVFESYNLYQSYPCDNEWYGDGGRIEELRVNENDEAVVTFNNPGGEAWYAMFCNILRSLPNQNVGNEFSLEFEAKWQPSSDTIKRDDAAIQMVTGKMVYYNQNSCYQWTEDNTELVNADGEFDENVRSIVTNVGRNWTKINWNGYIGNYGANVETDEESPYYGEGGLIGIQINLTDTNKLITDGNSGTFYFRNIKVKMGGEVVAEYYKYRPTFNVYCEAINGEGTFEGAGARERNKDAIIKAVPATGYKFVRWKDGVTSPERKVYVDGDIYYSAIFCEENLGIYDLEISAEGYDNPDLWGSGRYYEGEEVEIYAEPSTYFEKWSDDNTDNYRWFTIKAPAEGNTIKLTAQFNVPESCAEFISLSTPEDMTYVVGEDGKLQNSGDPFQHDIWVTEHYHCTYGKTELTASGLKIPVPEDARNQWDVQFCNILEGLENMQEKTFKLSFDIKWVSATDAEESKIMLWTGKNSGDHPDNNDGDDENNYSQFENNTELVVDESYEPYAASFSGESYYVYNNEWTNFSFEAFVGDKGRVGLQLNLVDESSDDHSYGTYYISNVVIEIGGNVVSNCFAPSKNVEISANYKAIGEGVGGDILMDGEKQNVGTYDRGDKVVLLASPNAESQFVRWSDGYIYPERTFYADDNYDFEALFCSKSVGVYDVTLTADGRSDAQLTGSGRYYAGETVTVSAKPIDSFEKWTDGSTESTDNPYTFTINQNTMLTAVFAKPTIKVVNAGEAGSVSILINGEEPKPYTTDNDGCSYYYWNEGDAVQLVATPNEAEGYYFAGWKDNLSWLFYYDGNSYTVDADFQKTIFSYDVDGNDNATITGYTGKSDVVIPVTIDGYTVTAIGNQAFFGNESITSVSFADGSQVTTIGGQAFQSCYSLTSIVFPEGVETIEGWALCASYRLKQIIIPNSVTQIGKALLENVNDVEYMTFDTESDWYSNSSCDDAYLIDKSEYMEEGQFSISMFKSYIQEHDIFKKKVATSAKVYIRTNVPATEGIPFTDDRGNLQIENSGVAEEITGDDGVPYYQYTYNCKVGDEIGLRATSSRTFNGWWNADGELESDTMEGGTYYIPNYNFTVENESYTLTAKFYVPVTVKVKAYENGTVSVYNIAYNDDGGEVKTEVSTSGIDDKNEYYIYEVRPNTTFRLEAEPAEGYYFATWGNDSWGTEVTPSWGTFTYAPVFSPNQDVILNHGQVGVGDITVENGVGYNFVAAADFDDDDFDEFTRLLNPDPEYGNGGFEFGKSTIDLSAAVNVTEINSWFQNTITSIILPPNVTIISEQAFESVKQLKSISISSDNQYYTTEDDVLYNKAKTTLVCYPPYKSGDEFTLPETVTSLAYGAFQNNQNLVTINGLDQITEMVNMKVFANCQKLKEVSLTGLTAAWLPHYTFEDSPSLEKVTLSSTITEFGSNEFCGCKNLTEIHFRTATPPTVVFDNSLKEFNGCNENLTFYVPKGCVDNYLNDADNFANADKNAFAGDNLVDHIAADEYEVVTSATIQIMTKGLVSVYDGGNSIDVSKTETLGDGNFIYTYNCTVGDHVTLSADNTNITLTFSGWFGNFAKEFSQLGDDDYALSNCLAYENHGYVEYITSYQFDVSAETNRFVARYVEPEPQFAYKYDANNPTWASIIGYTGYRTNLEIPAKTTINGVEYPITSIGREVFAHNGYLQSVTFADGCQLDTIYSNAFWNCSNLASITIPATVVTIEEMAFWNCTRLKEIGVASGNSVYTSSDGVLFNNDKTILICCPPGKDEAYSVPNSVQYIANRAFWSCSNLTSVSIHNSVESIGEFAFWGCSSMTEINVGSANAYYSSKDGVLFDKEKKALICCPAGNSGDEGVYTIPNSVKTIYSNAFDGCKNLTSVDFSQATDLTSIGGWAFQDCSSLTSLSIPESVTEMGGCVFAGCLSLQSANIPNGVCFINTNIISGCSNLTYLSFDTESDWFFDPECTRPISQDLYKDGDQFSLSKFMEFNASTPMYKKTGNGGGQTGFIYDYDDDNFTATITGYNGDIEGGNLVIPATVGKNDEYTVTAIGDNAFLNRGLQVVTLPSTLLTIGESAFEQNYYLRYVNIPSSVESIGEKAFYDCQLKPVFIPNSVTTLGADAFCWVTLYCQHTEKPDGWDESVINNCQITWNVTENDIRWYNYEITDEENHEVAFGPYFGSAEEYTIPNTISIDGTDYTVTSLSSSTFDEVITLKKVTIPEGVTEIPSQAFRICENLEEVQIPSTVASIAGSAFYGCRNLKTITLAEGNQAFEIKNNNTLFTKDGKHLVLHYAKQTPVDFVLPADVTEICDYAFDCSQIKSIDMSAATELTRIGDYAFNACQNPDFTSVSIPNSVTYLGQSAFAYANIQSVDIQASLETIKTNTFVACGFASVTIPESVKTIESWAFAQNSNLQNVTFVGESLEEVGEKAFVETGLTSLSLPNSVKLIGKDIVSGCYSLESLTFNTDVSWYSDPNLKNLIYAPGYTVTLEAILNLNASNALYSENYEGGNGGQTGFIYDVDGENATITGYNGNIEGGNLVIPARVGESDEYIVTAIGYNAFSGIYDIDTLSFENGSQVSTIGENAFNGCGNLRIVSIPTTVTVIGENAFNDTELSEVNYAGTDAEWNVIAIGDGNEQITDYKPQLVETDEITVNSVTELVTAIGSLEKNADITVTGTLEMNDIPNVQTALKTLHNNISKIRVILDLSGVTGLTKLDYSNSFRGCKNLISITLPTSVVEINGYAFSDCSALSEINVADGSEYFSSENGLLYNADKTTLVRYPVGKTGNSFTVPDDVTALSQCVFNGCRYLKNVTIHAGVSMGDCAFQSNTVIEHVTLPSDLTELPTQTFHECSAITEIELPTSLKKIGGQSLQGCGFASIDIPEGVTEIKWDAFYNCKNLTTITIPASLESIDESAFDDCSSITMVTVANGSKYFKTENNMLLSFNNDTLVLSYNRQSITDVNYLEGVTKIWNCAFQNCQNLTTVALPETIEFIGQQAFMGSGVTSIDIPEGVTKLEWGTFYRCSQLKTVSLPASLTEIGGSVFESCYSMETVYYCGSNRDGITIGSSNGVITDKEWQPCN